MGTDDFNFIKTLPETRRGGNMPNSLWVGITFETKPDVKNINKGS